MSKQTLYVQCVLKKGNSMQTSWIPQRYAKVGKYLKLFEISTDKWENGWQVISIGVKVSKDALDILSHSHKKTRMASDI